MNWHGDVRDFIQNPTHSKHTVLGKKCPHQQICGLIEREKTEIKHDKDGSPSVNSSISINMKSIESGHWPIRSENVFSMEIIKMNRYLRNKKSFNGDDSDGGRGEIEKKKSNENTVGLSKCVHDYPIFQFPIGLT